MKYLTLSALVLAACQGNPPAKPGKDLDPRDPRSLLEHAAYNTRTQKSYETTFKAKLAVPGSDALNYDGRCVWASPGVLFVHYTASGGDDKKIVRAGNETWVHHSLVGWVTADEAGMSGAGRGVQNPDDVLSVLARAAENAKLKRPGVIEMKLTGDTIEKIMHEQAQKGAFEWKESTATIELAVDGQNRLQKFTCDASLKSTNANVKGNVQYSANVELVDYNKAAEMKFQDEKQKPIPLDKPIQEAIDKVLKEKK